MRFVRRSAPPPPTLAEEESGPQTHFLGKDLVASPQDHTMVRRPHVQPTALSSAAHPNEIVANAAPRRAFAGEERMMDSGMDSRCRG